MTPFSNTSVQIVELSRDFMPSSKFLLRFPRPAAAGSAKLTSRNSDAGARKNLEHSSQVDDECQPVVMPKHADAMGDILGSLLQQVLGIHGIGPDHFVGGNADTQIIMRALTAQRSHHHMLRQQSRPPSFRNSDINQRHDSPAQIENARQISRP